MQDRRTTTHNSTYTQVGVQCFYESEVLKSSFVHLIMLSAKNPHLRVAANRYVQLCKNVNTINNEKTSKTF